MDAIATLELIQLGADGYHEPVQVQIGKPYREERRSWECPVLITSISERTWRIHGVDSMQALSLAIRFVHRMLRSELKLGYRLTFPGADTGEVDLQAYFGIGEPDGAANGSQPCGAE